METQLLINGEFTAGTESPETILNPRTGEIILDLPEASADQIDAAVRGAAEAFQGWSRTTPSERSAALLRIAARIEAEAEAFGRLEALNCGKPINAAIGDEIPAIVDCYRFFAGAVRTMNGPVAGEYLPGQIVESLIPGSAMNWIQLALATPVVLWGGWPFFVRGWQSVVNRSLNMFTLIALGVGVAYVFSVVATAAVVRAEHLRIRPMADLIEGLPWFRRDSFP